MNLARKSFLPYKNSTAILACSALKRQYRELLASYGSLRFYLIEGSFDLISRRLEQRDGHFMPSALLQSQFESLESFPNDGIVAAHLSIQEQIMQLEKLL